MRRLDLQAVALAIASAAVPATAIAAPPPPMPPSDRPQAGPATEGAPNPGLREAGGGGPPSPPSDSSSGASPGGGDGGPPTIDQRTLSEDVANAWGYSKQGAADPNYVRTTDEVYPQLNPIGYYQGVTLAGQNLPPFPNRQMGSSASVLTWTGFQGYGNVGRVFLQLSAPVAHVISQEGGRITLRLPTTTINVRNNARKLDTSFFDSPVLSVDLKRSGKDTIVTILLRDASQPQVSLQAAANGYSMLVLEFGQQRSADAGPPVITDESES